ncbi:unnamed protein product [marine sediment metagenome]|uniref:Uncharacterized protein n=1 Tax=marine sediment metagenome TaxID=412755 RepID=X1HKF9_9ZZZZ
MKKMVDVEKFIKKIELEAYVKEILAEIVQMVDKKIKEDMPGVNIAIRIELGIADDRTPRRKDNKRNG